MKFVIDEKGALVPAKEPTFTPLVIRCTKPIAKTLIYISLGVGALWVFLHFFPLVSLPVQNVIDSFFSFSTVQEAFTNLVHAKSV